MDSGVFVLCYSQFPWEEMLSKLRNWHSFCAIYVGWIYMMVVGFCQTIQQSCFVLFSCFDRAEFST